MTLPVNVKDEEVILFTHYRSSYAYLASRLIMWLRGLIFFLYLLVFYM